MTEQGKNNWHERYRADTEIQFFGTITASVSHELNNVISILNQTGGLLEDLLYGAKQGQEITPEQLDRIASKIADQTDRGIAIIRRLNSFAHTVDEPVVEFDLGEMVGNLMGLCARFAALRSMELTDRTTGESVAIVNSPIKVQQTLFLILKDMLGAGQKGDTVSYSFDRSTEGISIMLGHSQKEEIVLPNMAAIQTHAVEIGAKIETRVNPDGFTVTVTIPERYKE